MRNGDRAGADHGGADHGAEHSRPSRRTVLLGGAGVVMAGAAAAGYALVQSGVLPGKFALARLDGACGSPPAPPRSGLPASNAVTFYSAYRHRTVTMVTLMPAGASAVGQLGVVIGLHGADADARHYASQLGPAMAAARISGLAAVAVDGGNAYWHARANGDDPVGMIRHEVLPRLAAAGLPTSRIALVGESMGGYGALLLAEILASNRPRVTAVAALSPAIFGSYDDAIAASGSSFDSPADFARNDVISHVAALRSVPTWIGCGADDPFEPEASRMRTRLTAITGRAPAGGILPGCHDDAFWARNLPAALTFVARQTEEGR
jgi:S-formylglutathione hydrolase FrmB